MKTEIIIEVEECEDCPYHRARKVYTADSWDDCREVRCKKMRGSIVYGCLDWNEKSTVPARCPFRKKR